MQHVGTILGVLPLHAKLAQSEGPQLDAHPVVDAQDLTEGIQVQA